MAKAGVAPPLSVPWTWRVFEIVPLAPAFTGLLIVATWWLVGLLFAFASGDRSWHDGGWELYWAVLIGYLPMASAYSLRGAVRHLHLLRPALSCSDGEFEKELRGLTRFDRRELAAIGAIGIALGLALPFAPGFWVQERPPIGDPDFIWAWARMLAFSWLVFRTMHIEIATAARFSRIGSRWARINLLELEQLAPFARRGLASVLLVMGLSVLFSYQFAAAWQTGYLTLAALLGFASVAVIAFMLPVVGVHQRIRASKSETLERVLDAIRAQGDPTQQLREVRTDSRLPDLIAYKTLIESISTWPFDSPTLMRFSLFVSVGLGSWLGAAFVERLLDSALR